MQVIMLLSRLNSNKSDRTTVDLPSDSGGLNHMAHKGGSAGLPSRK